MAARKDGCSKCKKRYEELNLLETMRVDCKLICGDCLRQLTKGDTMHGNGKPTNPKDALGVKKAPLHCIPCEPLYELGLAMMEGGRKYGTHNYRAVGVRASVYYNAIMRHVTQWWEGQDVDSDSGLHPLIKIAASCVVMRDGILMDNYIDDRPIRYPSGKLNMPELNKKAGDIIEKYPDCVAPFLEKDEKKFVVSEGWQVYEVNHCGWVVRKKFDGLLLNKDFRLHRRTYWCESSRNYGEAPGYWPTKEAAEAALKQYLEKEKL